VVVVEASVGAPQLREAAALGICVLGNVGSNVMWRLSLLFDELPLPDLAEPVPDAPDGPPPALADPVVQLYEAHSAGEDEPHYVGRVCRAVEWIAPGRVSLRAAEFGVEEDMLSVRGSVGSVLVTINAAAGDAPPVASRGAPAVWRSNVSVTVCAAAGATVAATTHQFWRFFHLLVRCVRDGYVVPGGAFVEALWLRLLAPEADTSTAVDAVDAGAQSLGRTVLRAGIHGYVAALHMSFGDSSNDASADIRASVAAFDGFGMSAPPARTPLWHRVVPTPPLQGVTAAGCPDDQLPPTMLLGDVALWECFSERCTALRCAVDLAQHLTRTVVASTVVDAAGDTQICVM
jgi:hypothetical protein